MKLLLLHKPQRKLAGPPVPLLVNVSQVLWIETLKAEDAAGGHAQLVFETKTLDTVETPEMIREMCDPHGAPLTTT